MFCSQAVGEANPKKDIEKTKTSKADLVAAVKDAVAYCNNAFDSMTDAKGSEMVKLFNFNLSEAHFVLVKYGRTRMSTMGTW
jgi:hypothetical protein